MLVVILSFAGCHVTAYFALFLSMECDPSSPSKPRAETDSLPCASVPVTPLCRGRSRRRPHSPSSSSSPSSRLRVAAVGPSLLPVLNSDGPACMRSAAASGGPSPFPDKDSDGPGSPIVSFDQGSFVDVQVNYAHGLSTDLFARFGSFQLPSVFLPSVYSSALSVGSQTVPNLPVPLAGLVDVPVGSTSPMDGTLDRSPSPGSLLCEGSIMGMDRPVRLRRGRTAVSQHATHRPLPSGRLFAARARLQKAQLVAASASGTYYTPDQPATTVSLSQHSNIEHARGMVPPSTTGFYPNVLVSSSPPSPCASSLPVTPTSFPHLSIPADSPSSPLDVLGPSPSVNSVTYHKRTCFDQSNFGLPDIVCPHCGAYMWIQESVARRGGDGAPLFSLCCKQGKVSLPPRRPTPPFLDSLLDPNRGAIVTLHHQTYHKIGPLLPPDGCRPRYAQLYIYDCANEVSNRVSSVTGTTSTNNINRVIVEGLMVMFDSVNEVAKLFRMAKQRLDMQDNTAVRIRLVRDRGSNQKTYSLPTSSQVGGLIVGDFGRSDGDRDVIVEHRDSRLMRIGTVHPLYMALQYPILFPFGEDGFTPNIRYASGSRSALTGRQTLSMRDYYAYQLQQRTREGETLLRGGRLFQQFCVDCLSTVQEGELNWLKDHQNDIMADLYSNVRDLVHRGDTDVSSLGKRIILPASFTGSPRYLHQKYQDAMAICRAYGYPDLFITFTCNGNWPELASALSFYPGLRPEDRPDLVSRVFHIKLRHLLDDLMKRGHFGPALAVEFQKRGLPHAHILLWLQPSAKFKTPADIDRFVSAELPHQTRDPVGYDAVTSLMIHGPCGPANPRAPCMESGKCDKYFPKPFTRCTRIDQQGYPTYRRRDNGLFCVKSGVVLDNRYVVPHNVDLLVRYQAHINVEVCNQSRAIKYLFKYINKGPDRSRVVIESSSSTGSSQAQPVPIELNEIKTYLDCRAVLQLILCSPGPLLIGLCSPNGWLRIVNMPMQGDYYTVNSLRPLFGMRMSKKWEPRRKGKCIGRVIQINACAGELYYLRLLLNVVRGPRSYEEIRTVKGVLYDTFQAACKAAGLLGNDREWNDAMEEAAHTASPKELRGIFAMIIVFCQVSDPSRFFERHWRVMGYDIEHRMRRSRRDPTFVMQDADLRDLVLSSLEEILYRYGTSLVDKNLPVPQNEIACNAYDRLVVEEMSYDRGGLESDRSQLVALLNHQQRVIFDSIVGSVNTGGGQMYFVHGHGGTGKTFLWKALLAEAVEQLIHVLRSPLRIDQWSTCDIKRGTQLARLIQRTSLIVWDEAPMMHRHCIEALDRSLRDIRGSVDPRMMHKPFGGITVVFGGDLRQILPVIPGSSRSDVVCYTICNSPLWKSCHILHLTVNMRLTRPGLDPGMRSTMEVFGEWLLDVGDGTLPSLGDSDDCDGDLIEIPSDLLVTYTGDPIEAIVNEIYPAFYKNYADWAYLSQRAIVTPFNVVVDRINEFVLGLLPGLAVDFYSCDRVAGSPASDSGEISPYPIEFLNSLTSPGVPDHLLKLKTGSIVMLLQSLHVMVLESLFMMKMAIVRALLGTLSILSIVATVSTSPLGPVFPPFSEGVLPYLLVVSIVLYYSLLHSTIPSLHHPLGCIRQASSAIWPLVSAFIALSFDLDLHVFLQTILQLDYVLG
ncbi:DNA helicase PIF1, ATP-dependent [Corchorus olitorius]|uniref:ATP-dependent DNA helicase n=1 Tax=Corchorus olitorius TaxID=93759 RepID=A0A1R3IT72_9ROSI|nr:DNA helicase PIF1, ATP-dependent [Corchorus olitorius]